MIDPSGQTVDQTIDTRARLLEAAGEVFSERGFADATIREICGRAGANVAAVNYHFGDKAGLYKAVLRYADRCAAEFRVRARDIGSLDVPAPERLRLFIRAYVSAMLETGKQTWQGCLIAREMMTPSPLLDTVIDENIRPRSEVLRGIVRELLGERGRDDDLVVRASLSIIGQCLMYHSGRSVIKRLFPDQTLAPETLDAASDHIAAFSLAALAGLRSGPGEQA